MVYGNIFMFTDRIEIKLDIDLMINFSKSLADSNSTVLYV